MGICTRCKKRKADYGYKTCKTCRVKQNNTRRKRKENIRANNGYVPRHERYTIGLCMSCDNPIKPGYKVCEEHYQMNVKNARSEKLNKFRKDYMSNFHYGRRETK